MYVRNLAMKNNRYAVFIILTFLIYVMSNGQWCVPIFVWIYPILFLHMLSLNHARKVYLIIGSIYAIGFVFQFEKAIGMDIKMVLVRKWGDGFLKSGL